MALNHEAIYKIYPNVVMIDDDLGAFDQEGNQIEIDQTLIDAAAIEVATEQSWKNLRTNRNRLLAETDWVITMHKELETNIPNAWKTYRQALRDLPTNTTDPENPTWPTKPS
jgi:hypothetical protein